MNEGVDQGREDKGEDLIRREDIENTFDMEHVGRTGESEVL